MKIDNLSLPHPILSAKGGISGTLKFQVTREITTNEVSIKVGTLLDNDAIKELIQKGNAVYCLDITCPTTFYRRSFSSGDANFLINIPASDLRDTVEVGCYIIASNSFDNYENRYSDDIYGGVKFDISEGDVLAYGGRDSFEVPKKWETGKSGGAFFMLWKHGDKEVKYELGNDPILILLPEDDYSIIQAIKKNSKLRQVYLTLYAYPALVYVLSTIFLDTGSYSYRRWFKKINEILSEKRFVGIDKSPENAPKLAQMILEFPLSRSLNDLNVIIRDIEGS